MAAGLKTVILLSFVLAVGFLLIILSCALWHNWLPLLVGASVSPLSWHSIIDCTTIAITFVIAPLPNALFSHCGADDFSGSYEATGAVDLGRFLTSLIVLTGFAFPIILAHSGVISTSACVMSIVGGGLVYGTILAYSQAFKQDESEFD
ncbi:vacuolar protein sorting 55 superfamily protein [Lentinula aciculospora]|uniref:Vacuolar protein sorting 55 superfamily protein n=1 Tax=Lentinula aciculospora TaxID=153920 RepID=A0A9W9DW84_9AGAR|nr:vacuolar protein sorting 55 superfamily protein [Lentinula aciculospora]